LKKACVGLTNYTKNHVPRIWLNNVSGITCYLCQYPVLRAGQELTSFFVYNRIKLLTMISLPHKKTFNFNPSVSFIYKLLMWKNQQQQKALATPCKGTWRCTPKQAGKFVKNCHTMACFKLWTEKKCFMLDAIVTKYKNLPSSTPP
jgi:hypothetical protein